jgi:hypothetical protein
MNVDMHWLGWDETFTSKKQTNFLLYCMTWTGLDRALGIWISLIELMYFTLLWS